MTITTMLHIVSQCSVVRFSNLTTETQFELSFAFYWNMQRQGSRITINSSRDMLGLRSCDVERYLWNNHVVMQISSI